MHMTPEEQKEKKLENPVDFSSDDEQEQYVNYVAVDSISHSMIHSASTTCITKSEMIDWWLNLRKSKQSANITTASIAYGEIGINEIELSKARNQASLTSAKSSTISQISEQTDMDQAEQPEYRASDSSMTR